MTLDDAIRRERHAMRQSFGERSNEHRQLAEWLKELKQWKELAEGIDLRPASLMKPFQPNVNDLEHENDRLKAENEKLRELCSDLMGWIAYTTMGESVPEETCCVLEDRMTALGIEV